MRWARPEMLQLLWLLPVFTGLLWFALRARHRRLQKIVSAARLPKLASGYRRQVAYGRLAWRTASLAACLLALARPQWGFEWREVHRHGLDIMIALDTSYSMLATDVQPNRLQRAKWGIRDMIERLDGDRVGLLPFAGSAFLQCPLTSDYRALMMILDDIYAGIIPRGGTSIANALSEALERFGPRGDADRVLILVSDGENLQGDPLPWPKKLQQADIKLFTVGVGTPEGELIPNPEGSGFIRDNEGRIVRSRLDEGLLRQLARDGGGTYIRATTSDFGLERLLEDELSGLRRSEEEPRMIREHHDRYQYLVGAALAFLLLEGLTGRKPRVTGSKREADV